MTPVKAAVPSRRHSAGMDNGSAAGAPDLGEVIDGAALEHTALDGLLWGHLDAVIAGDFATALVRFDAFAVQLRMHLAIEERLLLPRLARTTPAPRWGAHVYRAEHDRIRLLLAHQRARLACAAVTPAFDASARRARSLAILDAARPLRAVLEHHQQREERGLFAELSGAQRSEAPLAK